MRPNPTLTAQRLREVLAYDADTGHFTWRVTLSARACAGKRAGGKHKIDGRIYIGVDGGLFKAHRLAWLYVHGKWPAAGIDHRDGDPSNNALTNLREATQAQNMQNVLRPHRDNKTGLQGVNRTGRRWFARLKVGPMYVRSKRVETPEEAHRLYMEIKRIFHPFATTGTNT